MTSKSKAKGNLLEREVAKYLSDKFNESFIRNISGSGAYVGGSNFHRAAKLSDHQLLSTRGDIHCPETFSNLNIECKSYKDFSWHQLLQENKQLDSWLEQLMQVSDDTSVNILVFKITRRGRYIAVDSIHNWNTDCNHSTYTNDLSTWVIYEFDKFFSLNSEKLKQLSHKATV